MKPWITRSLFAGIALAAAAAGVLLAPKAPVPAPASASASTRLAALSLPDLSGTMQPLAQWRGKIWVVNFWATWCTPCREEMPMLAGLSKKHADRVQFVGIGIDTPEAMRDFVKEVPVPYPLLVGGNEVIDLTAQLGNRSMALPYTVVIDAQGRVVGQHLGKITESDLEKMIGTHP